jgi:hypothetical protein
MLGRDIYYCIFNVKQPAVATDSTATELHKVFVLQGRDKFDFVEKILFLCLIFDGSPLTTTLLLSRIVPCQQ